MISDEKVTPTFKTVPLIEYLMLGTTWAGFAYGIYSRSLDDFMRYPGSIAAAIALLLYLRLAYAAYKEGRRPRKTFSSVWFLIVGPPVLSFGVASVYYSLAVSGLDLFLWFEKLSLPPTLRSAVWALVALAVGLLLFLVRLRFRAIYGLTEVAVGAGVVAHRAYSGNIGSSNLDFYLAILTAGIYLVVRGCDNVHTGLFKDPIDPIAAKLLTFFGKTTLPPSDSVESWKRFGLVDLFFGRARHSEK